MQVIYSIMVLAFLLWAPCSSMPSGSENSNTQDSTPNTIGVDPGSEQENETNEESDEGSDNEEDTSNDVDNVELTPTEEEQPDVKESEKVTTSESTQQTGEVTEQKAEALETLVSGSSIDGVIITTESPNEEIGLSTEFATSDIKILEEEMHQERVSTIPQEVEAVEKFPVTMENADDALTTDIEEEIEQANENSENIDMEPNRINLTKENIDEKTKQTLFNKVENVTKIDDEVKSSPEEGQSEKEEMKNKEVTEEKMTQPSEDPVEKKDAEETYSQIPAEANNEMTEATLLVEENKEISKKTDSLPVTEELKSEPVTLLSEEEIKDKLLNAEEAAKTESTNQPTEVNEIPENTRAESTDVMEEKSETDVPIMKLFSFELPLFNESLHRELLMNESEWAKELAAADHPDEENTIQDPCDFISENIHSVVGLNVTKEQVFNTLLTFKFLAKAETEDLTTIKEMLLTCVKGSTENQENSSPECSQLKALIVKTCRDHAQCRGKEDQIISKAMQRIREVIDTDQFSEALLMLRACAAQGIE